MCWGHNGTGMLGTGGRLSSSYPVQVTGIEDAVRRWWAQRADADRVHRLITLGTPHQGTWLARFALAGNARQLRPGSAWLRTLSAREPPGRSGGVTCFFSHCDNIIFPPRHAVMPGADEQHLPGVAHVHMIDHAAPWRELHRWLALR